MSEEKFDVIIVGAGIAGATAALMLAKEGLEVVVVERGNYAGAKNMTGGRLYSHSLEKIIPDFASKAPVERHVAKEKISMMTETGAVTVEYTSEQLKQQGKDSYIVLRGVFDRWLMEQAENAGAMQVNGILVEDLVVRDGKVCGIIAGGEEMLADVVILADGANSQLMQKAGLQEKATSPHQMAVGAKEVIELSASVIEDRFGVGAGEGAAWLFAGWPSDGNIGGGFVYTNKDSISIGIVATIAEMEHSEKSVHEMLEQFKAHPAVTPLLKDGKLVEYSGHMVAEGGYDMVPSLYDNGIVAIGDAAHLVINVGYTVRGMDLAVGSAISAAQAVIDAKEVGDFSSSTLSKYKSLLDDSFVMKDLKHFRKFPHFMENKRIFNDYPTMADDIFAGLFVVDGSEPKSMLSKLKAPVKKVGVLNLVKDGFKGIRAL
ncbi:MAG: FAD-dependent oxidoreductase [Deferribacterales bacterium]